MAQWREVDAETEREWRHWLSTRPDHVRVALERFPPWELYRLGSSGHRVFVVGADEDGENVTLRVVVSGQFNLVAFDRQVFGITADNLIPCDLPGDDALIGTAMTSADVEQNIDALRVMVRPDLFTMGADGKAVRNS